MKTQDRTKQQIKIEQLITYSPIAEGGQKLAALDENGVVCIYDDSKEEWIATNTSLKQPEKQEIEIAEETIKKIYKMVLKNGSADREWVLHKLSRILHGEEHL